MSKIYRTLLTGLTILGTSALSHPIIAQQKIDPTLEVRRDFDAKLLEIQKGKINATYSDTVGNFNLNFEYSIFDKPIKDLYEFSPLPSARIESASSVRQPVFYGNLGLNYPVNPHLGLYYQPNLPSSLSLTVYGKHNSYWGEIPLVNVDQKSTSRDKLKVSAPSSQNNLGVDFGYSWKGGELGVNMDYDNDRFSYYGYDHPQDPAHLTNGYMRDSLSRTYDKIGGKFFIRSTTNRPNSIYYSFDLSYDNLNDFNENYLNIGGVVGPSFGRFHKFLIGIRYQTSNSLVNSNFDRYDMDFHPHYIFNRDRWLFEIGLHFNKYVNPSDEAFNIFFKGDISYEMVKNRLWFYGMVDGKDNFRTYQSVVSENPWVAKDVDIQNTEEPIIARIGFKGQFKDRLSYNIYGGYTRYINHMNLFYHSNIWYGPVNTFIATYDDMHKFGFGGEFFWKSKDFESGLNFEYNEYTSKDDSREVYNLPPFELRAFGRYNWRERLIFGASAHFRSKTRTLFHYNPYSQEPQATDEYISSFAVFNIDATYVLNRKVSLYLKLNNILDANEIYHMYYGSPGRTIGAGVIFKL